MQKITPFLWFDGEAEEAMQHYVSIFKNSKVLGVTPRDRRFKVAKHFELDIGDGRFAYRRNHQSIQGEARLDGL